MINIKNKKIPVAIILISLLGIIIGYLIKDTYFFDEDGSRVLSYYDKNYALKNYEIYVFGYLIKYTHFLSVMLLILGLGIYYFLFKKDEEIKNGLHKFKNRLQKIKSNQNIINSLENFKNRLQKIKTPSAHNSVKKNTKDFFSFGESNKIIDVEESIVKEDITSDNKKMAFPESKNMNTFLDKKRDAKKNNEVKPEKIKNMFKTPFSFKGRIRRTEYGLSLLIIYLISFAIAPPGNNYNIFVLLDFSLINTIILLSLIGGIVGWFLFAQGAKRCHDMNCNGWYQLIPFYMLWMLFDEGDIGENKYGINPKEISNKKHKQNKTY